MMEVVDGERANSTDDSDEEEIGLTNAYSVDDLLGELSSDNDIEAKFDDTNSISAAQDRCDSFCPESSLSADNVCSVVSEEPADTAVEEEVPVLECHGTTDAGASVPFLDSYSRVYDEVLTEHVYQDPVERDSCLVTSEYINFTLCSPY